MCWFRPQRCGKSKKNALMQTDLGTQPKSANITPAVSGTVCGQNGYITPAFLGVPNVGRKQCLFCDLVSFVLGVFLSRKNILSAK